MNNYKLLNNIVGWLCFAIAFIVYWMTVEPTVPFWDCGEFISCSHKFEVGHQPGAPLFMILTNVFSTIFSGGDNTKVAMCVNMYSATVSAFTILFLFWTITAFATKMIVKKGEATKENMIAIIGAGAIGALAYAFTDSFWFNAVEGVVWSSSFFFTSMVFWCIMKWERVADEKYAIKYIILIAFLIGLSIGVHLLNLLTIPAVTFVYFFRRYKHQLTEDQAKKWIYFIAGLLIFTVGFSMLNLFVIPLMFVLYLMGNHKSMYIIIPSLAGMGILGFVQFKIIPGVIKLAAFFDLMFVNSFHMGFGSGVLFYVILGTALLIGGLIYSKRKNIPELNTIILCLLFIIIGYSSYSMSVIRAHAGTPLNEGDPQDVFSLQGYLGREQYGEWPILYGQYFNAKYIDTKEGDDIYVKDTVSHTYKSVGKKQTPVYDPEYCTLFVRMHDSEPNHVRGYKMYAGITDDKAKPTMAQNLTYFFTYQLNIMYIRYFMWNFVGRQNDIQGFGEANHGNWISGINFIDSIRLGSQDKLPQSALENKGRHRYYFLPLILGILGIFFAYKNDWKDALVITLLFFFLGLAIILYLNQVPYQPRERDYSYAASFYAFSIFLGLGVLEVIDLLRKKMDGVKAGFLALLICLVVPGILLAENYAGNNRSNRYTARDFSYDYLNSLAPNAIMFTGGDNDTFPLWYEQEVEGVRTDVRVIVTSLFNTDWYINTMRRKFYDSDPAPFSIPREKYVTGTRDYVPFYDRKMKDPVELKDFIAFVSSDAPESKVRMQNGQEMNYFPTKHLKMTIDSATIVRTGTVTPDQAGQIVKIMDFTITDNYLMKGHMMCLDMIATNNWKRPIYFAVSMENADYLGLEEYFQLEGLAYRLVPIKHPKSQDQQPGGINTKIMYDNVMNKFKWGGMETGKPYLDDKIRNMTINLRNNFERLAEALLLEGKKDSAIKVLDKCIAVIPEKVVPYDVYLIRAAEIYYQAGAIEQGNKLAKRLAEIYENDLAYYVTLKGSDAKPYDREKQQAQAVINELARLAKDAKQDALSNQISKGM